MTRHHAFSLEVCIHDRKTAEYVRIKLAELRAAIGEDLHVFRITETVQTDREEAEDNSLAIPAASVHLAS